MRIFFTITTIAWLAGSGSLVAQDFYGVGVSADTNRRAGIFSPSSNSPMDALALNPAGLTALSAPTVNLSLAGIFARGSFSNASNISSPMASNEGYVPFGAFGLPIGARWVFGVGVAPDLLSASKWNYSDTPGFAGTTYGPQAEKSEIVAIRAAAGVAYRVTDKISTGITFGADYNSNTLDAPYIFQSNPALAGLKTLLDLHTTGYGFNAGFGVTAKPSKRFDLGASFRTSTSITSHGGASGNIGAEFQSVGLVAQPDFGYRAQVHVKLPPSALLDLGWQASPTVRFIFQTDWIGWHGAFKSLPVRLTQGTNSDINSLLGSTTIRDTVPLEWKDQVTFRGAVERSFGERFVIGAGYLHGNDPVPNSTLSPLTAAIMQNSVTSGIGWRWGRTHLGISYGYGFMAQGQVRDSALLFDEFDKSKTKIGSQAFVLSSAFTL
jgi:long-subunit fatty acid transport protein